ncbi:MAG: YwqG family protein, partial [Promethearchaeota archaeon]
ISSFSDQIMTRIKKKIKIRIKPTSEDEIKIGESKIGGRPDLPKGVKWPKFDGFPLLFLMQINLSELKELQSNQFTKDKGILFFFYDDYSTGWSLEEKKCVKVIYSGDLEKLVRTDFPKKKIKASNYFNNKLSFDSHKIIFSEAISLPPANGWWYGGYYDNNYIYQEPDLLKDKNFNNFLDNKTDAHDFQISLFGYPSYFGCDAHQLGCLLFSNKRDPFEFEHKADRGMTDEEIKELEALEKKAGEWTLLLQVCSDDDLNGYDVGWQWGDAGILYFWIREEDLKQNNFNNLRVFLEQH